MRPIYRTMEEMLRSPWASGRPTEQKPAVIPAVHKKADKIK